MGGRWRPQAASRLVYLAKWAPCSPLAASLLVGGGEAETEGGGEKGRLPKQCQLGREFARTLLELSKAS